jgi:hypothetical protein
VWKTSAVPSRALGRSACSAPCISSLPTPATGNDCYRLFAITLFCLLLTYRTDAVRYAVLIAFD